MLSLNKLKLNTYVFIHNCIYYIKVWLAMQFDHKVLCFIKHLFLWWTLFWLFIILVIIIEVWFFYFLFLLISFFIWKLLIIISIFVYICLLLCSFFQNLINAIFFFHQRLICVSYWVWILKIKTIIICVSPRLFLEQGFWWVIWWLALFLRCRTRITSYNPFN